MAESDFSWFKLASFFGAAVLAVLTLVMVAFGIQTIYDGSVFYGIVAVLGGLICAAVAMSVYQNYQKKSLDNRA